jgi:hypothetical protein
MLHQGFPIKTRFHKVGVTNATCTLVVGMKWMSMPFEDARLPRPFRYGFKMNLTIILLLSNLGKVLS